MDPAPVGIIVAALGGLAVGIERQWSGHAVGPRARFAGVRTFSLLGILAGLTGWLWTLSAYALATVLAASASALIVAAYVSASRTEIDATTEVGALVVLGAGMAAGAGYLVIASGIIAATSLLLVEKSKLHTLVARLDDEALRATARFGVMAAVVLPLLPQGPYPPWDSVRPRELWVLVLFFSGISFVGYIARRAIGARHGYPLAGLLGGLVSSTSVTFTFARASRQTPSALIALAFGAVAACTVMLVRVAVASAVLNGDLAAALWPYLLPPFAVGALFVLASFRHTHDEAESVAPLPANPLQIGAALQMAAIFQVVLIVLEVARRWLGNVGVVASGAVLGLTDLDALTISMARGAGSSFPLDVAARAIATGIVANTALKMAVALAVGGWPFGRRVGAALAAMALTVVVALASR